MTYIEGSAPKRVGEEGHINTQILTGHDKLNYSSQIGQDYWVALQSNIKRQGSFLDVGSGHPKDINNTYFLEKNLDWCGLSIDIGDPYEDYQSMWERERDTPLLIEDALKIDFDEVLPDYFCGYEIDYLSLDLEPPTLTLEALLKILKSKFTFNFVTFETDHYRCKETREISRHHMKESGYSLAKTVSNGVGEQEDWYIRE